MTDTDLERAADAAPRQEVAAAVPSGAELAAPGPPLPPSEAEAFRRDLAAAAEAIDTIVDSEVFPVSFWVLPAGIKYDTAMPGKDRRRRGFNETVEEYRYRRYRAIGGGAYAVVWGQALGMPAPAALNSVHIIGGKVGMEATAIRSLITSRGHQWRWVGTPDATRAAVKVRRREDRDDPEAWQEFEFTMERAVRAGYVPGKGPNEGKTLRSDVDYDEQGRPPKGIKYDQGNERYLTNPEDMLAARLTSTVGKLVFADVIKGMDVLEVLRDEAGRRPAIEVQVGDADGERPVSMAELAGPRPAAEPAAEPGQDPGGAPPSPPTPDGGSVATPDAGPAEPVPMTTATELALSRWFEDHGLAGAGVARRERRNWIVREVLNMPDLAAFTDLDEAGGLLLLERLAGLPKAQLERFGAAEQTGDQS